MRRADLNLLVVLDALLDERSVTRAAERLALSQPAVSGALARLRALFGDPLFTRVQRGLVPTDRAIALAEPTKLLLRQAGELLNPPAFDPTTADREVRIATTDYMIITLIAPFLRFLQERSPNIRLIVRSLESSDIASRLANGELDLGITIPEFAAPGLQSRLLYTDHYIGAVRRGHPLLESKVTVSRFCDYRHTLVVPRGGEPHGPLDDALASVGGRRIIGISLPNFLTIPTVLDSTDFIAVGPKRLFQTWSDRLALFEVPVPVPSFDNIAVWHPRAQNDVAHRWIREQLRRIVHQLGEPRNL